MDLAENRVAMLRMIHVQAAVADVGGDPNATVDGLIAVAAAHHLADQAMLRDYLYTDPGLPVLSGVAWDSPVALIVASHPYLGQHLDPPTGNVHVVDPTTDRTLLLSLADAGLKHPRLDEVLHLVMDPETSFPE